MPNWKMRANGAGRGQADHQALQDAELRIRLHDAHQAHDRVPPVMKLSVSSVTANSCCAPQRSQKSQKFPALKPVLTARRR